MISTLFWDIGLSVIVYFAVELLGGTTYLALLAGTVVSAARTAVIAVRQRRLDPFSLFMLVLFGAGLSLAFTTGDVRFVLAKDSATTGTAGLVMLVSCLIRRPLAYYAAKRFASSSGNEDDFESTASSARMRRRWYRVSLVWGVGLTLDSVLRIVAAYTLPLNTAANLSQIMMIVFISGLFGWTLLSARAEHRKAVAAGRQ
jgi:hypothetical protein